MMKQYRRHVLTVVTFASLVGACANNPDPGGVALVSGTSRQQSDGRTDEGRNREFAKCMREHGVDVPDPEPGRRGVTIEDLDPEKVRPAREACRDLLPNGGVPEQMGPEELDKARERAKCMREHGVDVPDPDPNNPGIRMPAGVDREKTRAAMEACRPADAPDGDVRTGTNG